MEKLHHGTGNTGWTPTGLVLFLYGFLLLLLLGMVN